jgi:hypothetical protein
LFVDPLINALLGTLTAILPMMILIGAIGAILQMILRSIPYPRSHRFKSAHSEWTDSSEPDVSWDPPAPTQPITLDYIMSLDWTPKKDTDD